MLLNFGSHPTQEPATEEPEALAGDPQGSDADQADAQKLESDASAAEGQADELADQDPARQLVDVQLAAELIASELSGETAGIELAEENTTPQKSPSQIEPSSIQEQAANSAGVDSAARPLHATTSAPAAQQQQTNRTEPGAQEYALGLLPRIFSSHPGKECSLECVCVTLALLERWESVPLWPHQAPIQNFTTEDGSFTSAPPCLFSLQPMAEHFCGVVLQLRATSAVLQGGTLHLPPNVALVLDATCSDVELKEVILRGMPFLLCVSK
jgi:hypothetical protein